MYVPVQTEVDPEPAFRGQVECPENIGNAGGIPERVRVFADYTAFPVWSDVPMSDSLREDFWKWAAVYEGIMELDFMNDENVWPTHLMPRNEWVVMGRTLSKRLKAELGNRYEVAYSNDLTDEVEIY